MSAGVDIVRDQVYASPGGRDLLADLYLPADGAAPPQGRPAIVWIHGGGWRFGDRRLAPDLARHYAARGFVMISIDYRLSREAVFPAALEDVKTAIRWVKSMADAYRIDPRRVGLWGSSAGGHLASLATASVGVFEGEEHLRYGTSVAAVVDCYGPSDFLQMDAARDPDGTPSDDAESIQLAPGKRSADADSLESLFIGAPVESCPDKVLAANPIHYARPGLPPFLLLHGLSDTAVPWQQSWLWYRALTAQGGAATLGLITGLGHGFTNRPHLDDTVHEITLHSSEEDIVPGPATRRVFEFIGDWFEARLGSRA